MDGLFLAVVTALTTPAITTATTTLTIPVTFREDNATIDCAPRRGCPSALLFTNKKNDTPKAYGGDDDDDKERAVDDTIAYFIVHKAHLPSPY